MKKKLKIIKQFHIIIIILSILFSTIIFLSLPVLYNYENIQDKLERKIISEFKIYLTSSKKIQYAFIPSPHLLIEEADIGFLENKGGNIAKLQNVKVFISLLDIYNNKTIKIKKIKIQKANFNFNYE